MELRIYLQIILTIITNVKIGFSAKTGDAEQSIRKKNNAQKQTLFWLGAGHLPTTRTHAPSNAYFSQVFIAMSQLQFSTRPKLCTESVHQGNPSPCGASGLLGKQTIVYSSGSHHEQECEGSLAKSLPQGFGQT